MRKKPYEGVCICLSCSGCPVYNPVGTWDARAKLLSGLAGDPFHGKLAVLSEGGEEIFNI